MAYLYGASVQGIQEFIFQTNRLREIVGASEIVKSIDTMIEKFQPDEILVQAAGNIKVIFYSKDKLEEVVKNFPKQVMQQAFGITISQAVVKFEGDSPNNKDLNTLAANLKIQRNKPSVSLDYHINILELYRKTARPSWAQSKEKLDVATQQKSDAYAQWFQKEQKINPSVNELKELTALSNGKNKIAVIHADGNDLGQLISHLKERTGLTLKDFSKKLDIATHKAFDRAQENKEKIRPVILGGDDMTVVCDANIALEFTKDFLQFFEEETEKQIGHKLTACAGIAYSNEKYPLHYALDLAEELTKRAKEHAKGLREIESLGFVPASLMFHNIQSSNFQSWKKFVQDELTIVNDQQTIRLDFGPYYLSKENQPKIQDFISTTKEYGLDGSPISKLRNWLGTLHKSSRYAQNQLHRINEVAKTNYDWDYDTMNNNLHKLDKQLSNEKLIIQKDDAFKTPVFDVLQILSVTEAK